MTRIILLFTSEVRSPKKLFRSETVSYVTSRGPLLRICSVGEFPGLEIDERKAWILRVVGLGTLNLG